VGTFDGLDREWEEINVSIQLVSPASGDKSIPNCLLTTLYRFHSISFPSEWGHLDDGLNELLLDRFHSISFPSEWGQERKNWLPLFLRVSIQLVSPASGDL